MTGTDVAIEALGEVIAAYKARIAELEALAAAQQRQIADLQSTIDPGDVVVAEGMRRAT